MMRIFVLFGVLLISVSVHAQQQSPPFELAHPTTREPGVWLPVWAQQLHLQTDAALKTCSEERVELNLKIDAQTQEIVERNAASSALTQSVKALNFQLAGESIRAQAAEDDAETYFHWALVATGSAVVAALVIAVQAL